MLQPPVPSKIVLDDNRAPLGDYIFAVAQQAAAAIKQFEANSVGFGWKVDMKIVCRAVIKPIKYQNDVLLIVDLDEPKGAFVADIPIEIGKIVG